MERGQEIHESHLFVDSAATLIVERNHAAVDRALGELRRIEVPADATPDTLVGAALATIDVAAAPPDERDFVERVTATMIAGNGDLLPVSALGGAILLTLADVVGRVVARPEEIEVGIVTALLGAPFFIALVRRQRMRAL